MSDLEALRRASGALERERVIDALDRAFQAWSAPGSLWRQRLRRDHETFSADLLEVALTRGELAFALDLADRLRQAAL